MQKLLIFLAIIITLPACDPDCSSSPSCIAPPDGSFQNDAINLAIYENILEEVETNSYQSVGFLDSVIVRTSRGDLSVSDFYRWEAITEGSSITSIDFYYDEKSESLEVVDFVFNNTEQEFTSGGYLLTIIKTSEDFALRIDRASQDLIDGVCNDTFVSC